MTENEGHVVAHLASGSPSTKNSNWYIAAPSYPIICTLYDPIPFHHIVSNPIPPRPMPSHPILSCPVPSRPILPHPVASPSYGVSFFYFSTQFYPIDVHPIRRRNQLPQSPLPQPPLSSFSPNPAPNPNLNPPPPPPLLYKATLKDDPPYSIWLGICPRCRIGRRPCFRSHRQPWTRFPQPPTPTRTPAPSRLLD